VPAIVPIHIDGRELRPHKAVIAPLYGTRTVLTKSPWGFVSLWLKREQKNAALVFWDQAREFYEASIGRTLQSSPLLLYYSFMNAAKALLTAKGITFNPYHGVRAAQTRGPADRITLSNEKVALLTQGVLPSLSAYLGEAETTRVHSLQEILFNLPFIHRTYCLTYKSQSDMFMPLTDCEFVFETKTKQAYLRANLSKDFAHSRFLRRLPPCLIPDPKGGSIRAIRSTNEASISSKNVRSAVDLGSITVLNRQLRTDVQYINGSQALWYVKGIVAGPKRLARFPLTLVLGAMHRLSEICRYRPVELASFLVGQKNWLLSEFIALAPGQFMDELAAEITGYQFLAPNVRPPT
jgi:hypothetical protein